jgi:hypothetical protein
LRHRKINGAFALFGARTQKGWARHSRNEQGHGAPFSDGLAAMGQDMGGGLDGTEWNEEVVDSGEGRHQLLQ